MSRAIGKDWSKDHRNSKLKSRRAHLVSISHPTGIGTQLRAARFPFCVDEPVKGEPVKKTVADMPIKKDQQGTGNGGELHQRADGTHPQLTTQQGQAISDDENSLKASDVSRPGPVLLEDFVLREKINHFDHERIPERIVHARGAAAHGFFELTE